jgi:hypothetical protein
MILKLVNDVPEFRSILFPLLLNRHYSIEIEFILPISFTGVLKRFLPLRAARGGVSIATEMHRYIVPIQR